MTPRSIKGTYVQHIAKSPGYTLPQAARSLMTKSSLVCYLTGSDPAVMNYGRISGTRFQQIAVLYNICKTMRFFLFGTISSDAI